jgi:hypothetical protein
VLDDLPASCGRRRGPSASPACWPARLHPALRGWEYGRPSRAKSHMDAGVSSESLQPSTYSLSATATSQAVNNAHHHK